MCNEMGKNYGDGDYISYRQTRKSCVLSKNGITNEILLLHLKSKVQAFQYGYLSISNRLLYMGNCG